MARLFAECGVICLTAFISPLRAYREEARRIIGPERFFEIHVATDLQVCEQRDIKGLYRKARNGEIPDFTGVSAPYEPPEDPALRLDTGGLTLEDSVARLHDFLAERRLIAT